MPVTDVIYTMLGAFLVAWVTKEKEMCLRSRDPALKNF
jgi:hypothetical protein